jgi:hypothetical protein
MLLVLEAQFHFLNKVEFLLLVILLNTLDLEQILQRALPFAGGVPIQDNEVDMKNGGLVVYTSTDQAGNFRIGDGVTINQTTGTISGTILFKKFIFNNDTIYSRIRRRLIRWLYH